jgi:hypothetical protein
MSNPERLIFRNNVLAAADEILLEELRVVIHSADDRSTQMVVSAVPTPKDIALCVANSSGDWWRRFGAALRDLHQERYGVITRPRQMELSELRADVEGADADPGFGVDPKDSQALLELRHAIDCYLG